MSTANSSRSWFAANHFSKAAWVRKLLMFFESGMTGMSAWLARVSISGAFFRTPTRGS